MRIIETDELVPHLSGHKHYYMFVFAMVNFIDNLDVEIGEFQTVLSFAQDVYWFRYLKDESK